MSWHEQGPGEGGAPAGAAAVDSAAPDESGTVPNEADTNHANTNHADTNAAGPNAADPNDAGGNDAGGGPARRSRRRRIVGDVVVALAVVAVFGVVVVAFGGSHRSNGPAAAPPANGSRVILDAPDDIGSLHKSADQSRADRIRAELSGTGLQRPFAVVYADRAAGGRVVMVWGGTSALIALGGDDAQIDGFFSASESLLGTGVTATDPVSVDPGATGGAARCEKIAAEGAGGSLCVWVGQTATICFAFTQASPEEAGPRVSEVLAALVR